MRFHHSKMRYSIEPRDRIYGKGYRFLSFAKNIDKSLNKNLVKKLLLVLKNLQRMQLKLLQKDQFKKQQKQVVI